MYPANGSPVGRYWRSDNLASAVYPKLKRGAWRVLREASSFLPDLHSNYVDVCQGLDKDIRMDTIPEDEPFTLPTLLINLSSEDHTDSKDCGCGIAALTQFGNFEGNFGS
jgi:hypothetical protein